MDAPTPYLSVVATSRNDDHGANLKRRMQTFVNAFINQCKRHDLNAELILVEWNPPADRPKLAEALNWPADTRPCQVRIIEVCPALHQKLKHSAPLPLFQMIGKNAGIRRARGQFILATNIDILLNDELMQFLKSGSLQRGVIYRVDRTDVETEVPQDASVDEQIAFCRTHMVRNNMLEGTFPLLPAGERIMEKGDIVAPGSGIILAECWLERTRDTTAGKDCVFRWMRQGASIDLRRPPGTSPRLLIELEGGPAIGFYPFEFQVQDETGAVVAQSVVESRGTVSVRLPLAEGERRWFRFHAVNAGPPAPGTTWPLVCRVYRMSWEQAPQQSPGEADIPFFVELHRNTTFGDVVAEHAQVRLGAGWMEPEEEPAGIFRWGRSGAEVVVLPQGRKGGVLQLSVRPGPGVAYQPFRLYVQDENGKTLASRRIGRRIRSMAIRLPLQAQGKTRFRLVAEGGGRRLDDDRWVRDFQLFDCGWANRGRLAQSVRSICSAVQSQATRVLQKLRLSPTLSAVVKRVPPPRPSAVAPTPVKAPAFTPPLLHLNACGDFTLMAREHWFDLRGYVEFEMYSMHIDSVLCYAAHYAGLRERVLPVPMRAYHIEHDAGSGWTPEGHTTLYARLAARGIPVISDRALVNIARGLSRQGPLAYSTDDWGFVNETLPETCIGA